MLPIVTQSTEPSVLRSRRIVTPEGIVDGYVSIAAGEITAVGPEAPPAGAGRIEDLGRLALLPGLVDTHVHVNEPGRTEWEGFATAGRAALAGGITTIVDMPLNSIPATTTADAVEEKRQAAGACGVRVEMWGGVVPGNAGELELMAAAGVRGFKCFLVPSGVDEFAHVGEADLREAMPVIARLGLPLLVHAELPEPIEPAAAAAAGGDPRSHATWLASRPPAAEIEAIQLMIRLCAETGCRVHIVHLSAAEALPDLAAARDAWLPITVETCPHYLTFAAEDIPDGATQYKCAPPIRVAANRERLWDALLTGDIDFIASDHSPCPPAMKRADTGDFFASWGGIASLEVAMSAVWTGSRAHGATMVDLAEWLSERPARLAGIAERRGAIAPAHDADLVAFDPDSEWVVDPARLRQRHPVTPYAGMRLRGRVERVWVGGNDEAP